MNIVAESLFSGLFERVSFARQTREKDLTYFKRFIKNRKVCIFGAGVCGNNLYYNIKKICNVEFFCDNDLNKVGRTVVDDVMCISLNDLIVLKESVIIFVSSAQYGREIYKQLKSLNFKYVLIGHNYSFNRMVCSENDISKEDIDKLQYLFRTLGDEESRKVLYKRLKAYVEYDTIFSDQTAYDDIYSPDQYFCKELINFNKEDVIVDCGAYIGDTLESFINLKMPFKRYICLELNKNNYVKLCKTIRRYGDYRIDAFNYGVGKDRDVVYYDCNHGSGTQMQLKDFGEGIGEIINLDTLINDQISFIKMDIEGAEMDALSGGKNLIISHNPNLAICVYHKFSDLWQIPLWIHSIVPEYDIYLRHHMYTFTETVCYAIKK